MEETESKKDRFKPLTYEDMYGVEEPEPDGRPLELDIDTLLPFPNQPFHPYKEEEMEKMVESIKENGVISPIVVRPKDDGTYEIISGHNRVEACRQAGIMKIPSFIREVDDDTAVILMVDSNLRQREKLFISEKVKAYKLKMEALNRKAGRPSKNLSQLGSNFMGTRSTELLSADADDSPRQIQRYLRLDNLSPALLDMVDKGKLAFNPAVEISYLDPADQAIVQEVMEREETAPSLSQAQKLKKMAAEKTITDKRIVDVLTVEKPMYETITFRFNTVEKYFPEGTTGKEIEEMLYAWMEQYRQQWQGKLKKGQER